MNLLTHIAYNLKRELRMIFRDPGAILILCLAMIIYPLVYSYAYSGELLRESRLAVVDMDNTQASRTLVRMACATEQLQKSRPAASVLEAKEMFYAGDCDAVLMIPCGFEKNIMDKKSAPIKLYADGSYMLSYKQAYSGLVFAAGTMGGGIEVKRLLAQGHGWDAAVERQDPISPSVHQLFNPASGYGSSIMPGMILIIMQQTLLIGIGLVGGTFRERGKHKLFSLADTWRGGPVPIVLGKSLAYLLLYLINSVLALVIIYGMFDFPDQGGFVRGLAVLIPFLMATIFMGMSISLAFARRINSLLFLVFLSPIVLFLSGISWPIQALPMWLQDIACLFPVRFAVPAYVKVRLQGSPWSAISADYLHLWIQVAVYAIIVFVTHTVAYRSYFRSGHPAKKI